MGLTVAKDSMDDVIDKADAVTKAIDSFIAKVRDIKFTAKVDDADIDKLTDDRKKYISEESKLLEGHRKENKEILSRHFYDMSNMMSRNEGVWLSNGVGRRLCFGFSCRVFFIRSFPLSILSPQTLTLSNVFENKVNRFHTSHAYGYFYK